MRRPVASEPFEYDGVWWPVGQAGEGGRDAEDAENSGSGSGDRAEADGHEPAEGPRVRHGTLTYQPEVGLRLKLTDAFEPGFPWGGDVDFDAEAPVPVVHGRLLDGRSCTLLDAFVKHEQHWWPAGGRRVALVANLLILGEHVKSADELRFARADVRLRGLREFLRQPPLGNESGGQVLRAEGERASVAVQLEGAELTFGLGWRRSRTRDREVSEVDAYAFFDLDEPAPLSVWEDGWVRRAHDLVVFATRELTWIEGLTAILRDEGTAEEIHPAIRRAASDEAWERREVHIVRPRAVLRRGARERSYNRVIFGPGDLGERFEPVVRRWFELNEHLGGAAAFFFGALNAPSGYLENRLLNLTSFAEAYHRTLHDEPPLTDEEHERLKERMLAALDDNRQRDVYRNPLRYANAQSQRRRLRWLIERAASVLDELAPHAGPLRGQLVDTRNYFAHLDERSDDVVEGAELLAAVNRLVLVLQVNILLDLGLDAERIGALLRRSYANSGWP